MDHHDTTDAGSHAFHESSPAHQHQEPHVVSASLSYPSSPSSPSVSGSPYRHCRRPHHAAAWVGTQLSVIAATGLASSHSAPFVRVLYQIPSSSSRGSRSSKKKKKATKVVCLDNQDSRSCRHRLRREQNGRYTAIWEKHPSCSSGECDLEEEDGGDFLLPPSIEYLEIQVWNQFPNGFDVFLGMATLAISSLYQQQQQQPQQLPQQVPNSSIIRTPLMWIPLQVSNDKVNDSRTNASVAIAQMNLSVQLQVGFFHDTKALCIRQQIAQRYKEKKTSTENPVQSITDPAFAFTKPFQVIDWSAVVSTSVRHIFFHADVDRLNSFKTQVMYGDLLHELQEDEGFHVHDDHLSAFQLSQLSAQYLSHCVDTLTTRCEEYSDQYRILAETRSNLLKTRSQLKRQRDHLKKESAGLDLLLSTYKSITDKDKLGFSLEQNGHEDEKVLEPLSVRGDSPLKQSPVRFSSSPLSKLSNNRDKVTPSSPDPLVSKKPAFLMTWEERERERKLEKERSKSKRIEDEKKRLEQLMRDRKSREEHQLRLSNLVERGHHRAATTIQRFFHHKLAHYKHQQIVKALTAATRIQSWLRGYICRTKVVPKVEEQRRCARELDLMAQNEREMRGILRCEYERELVQRIEVQTEHDQEQQHQHQHHASPVLSPLSSPLLKQDVSALVSMYWKLRRIFLLAYRQHGDEDGSAYQSLFAKLDLRQDGALDRAEFRLGVRNFGIRIDRKLTRALIALVRAKCGAQPQPLHLSLDQFVKGFDLPVHDPSDGNTGITPFEKVEQRRKAHQEPRSLTTARDSKEVEDDKNNDDEGPSTEADQIVVVSRAVENLRLKILDAAKSHLEAQGKQFSNYRDFRDALTFVFEEFDVNKNGKLDLDELVACVESINFQVTSENLALLRDCFTCDDDDGDGKISIPEFISFALATGGGSTGHQQTEENLGIVGSRLREAVLERVRAAQKQTETVEDAVRSVFQRAYSRKDQQTCTATIFIKVLSGLKLPVRPAQLARLVMKLDKDGDHSISFDELLLWLRLRRASELVARHNNSNELFSTNLGVRRHSHVAKASATAKLVRSVLYQLAGLPADNNPNAMSPSSPWRPALIQVFGKIDRNGSKKVTREEVQGFLAAQDTAWLLSLLDASGRMKGTELELTSPDSIPLVLADAVVNTIDLNRNGVVTLNEWLEFLEQPEVSGDREEDRQTDRFALINSVRALLLEAVKKDEAVLIAWFHGLSGALPAASASGGGESQVVVVMKVRVNVFKTALRAKLGAKSISVPLQAIDEAVKRLDSDSSGWVTTRELQNWAFPIQDLEELSRAIASRWRVEAEHARNAKKKQETDFALALYSRFDADGNGILAQREIRGGFASFGLQFKIEEVAALTKAFDLDQDGCWSKAEFLAFVYTLFPHAIFPKSPYSTAVLEAEAHVAQTATESDAGIAAGSKMKEDTSDEENYSREGFLSSHSSSSSISSASAARSSLSPARDASQLLLSPTSSTAGSKAADYSQDFD